MLHHARQLPNEKDFPMRYLPFALLLLVAPLAAEDLKPKPPVLPPVGPVELTEADKKFDGLVREVEAVLRASSGYTVHVTCDWSAKGNGPDRSGTNELSIAASGSDKVRIEASGAGEGSFVVVGDGKELTRLFATQKVYNRVPSTKTLDDLQTDALTRHALKGSGVDFLLRTDMIGTIHAQTRTVNDMGFVTRGEHRLQAFRLTLADGRIVDVLVKADPKAIPLPVEIKTTVSIPLPDNPGPATERGSPRTFELVLNTKLKWNLAPDLPAETFKVALPEGAKAVDDLMQALLEGDVATLLGKPAPALTFVDLEGQKVDVASYKDKNVVVVYFWATWAAPSIRDMPGLKKYVADYTARGVTFLSVAVGDKPEDVKSWVEREGYPGKIAVDEKATMLAALKTNALPSAAVIGKDGTLQAFYRGNKHGMRDQIKQDLEHLLKGESLTGQK
jgi:peroxiredoxin